MPMPSPAMMSAGRKVYQCESVSATMTIRPMPAANRTRPIIKMYLPPMRSASHPALGAVTMAMSDIGTSVRPAWSAVMPQLRWRGPPALGELGPPAPVVSLKLLHGRVELRLILGMRNPQSLSKGAQPDGDFVEVLEARDMGQRVRQRRPHLGEPRGLRSIQCDRLLDAS